MSVQSGGDSKVAVLVLVRCATQNGVTVQLIKFINASPVNRTRSYGQHPRSLSRELDCNRTVSQVYHPAHNEAWATPLLRHLYVFMEYVDCATRNKLDLGNRHAFISASIVPGRIQPFGMHLNVENQEVPVMFLTPPLPGPQNQPANTVPSRLRSNTLSWEHIVREQGCCLCYDITNLAHFLLPFQDHRLVDKTGKSWSKG
ncbi:hypothetical protein VFPPC_09450 [Pochonia chlamydosporia 170]|uniref:Uncharacterized protein n=1 Tax=Pochonia chlamydosporia 170 TaxID=1380566 RepID=A0A179F885_METCM|nr:hypothetical protein VFPPC_09450 [Pochonia chlamydosporia 170]OAQ61637.1 hypothetical protein VFPPC_09450 [Pochonia chlamydosporia 170]